VSLDEEEGYGIYRRFLFLASDRCRQEYVLLPTCSHLLRPLTISLTFPTTARIQIDPALARTSLLTAGRKIIAAEGPRGLLTGFAPTSYGYLLQGGAKFAGYEFWKKQLVEMVGSQEGAVKYRTAIYLAGASIAE
jgi:hypothetical protein